MARNEIAELVAQAGEIVGYLATKYQNPDADMAFGLLMKALEELEKEV